MSCPLYGRNADPTNHNFLAVVPFNVCGLTDANPCDMKAQGMEPDFQVCPLYQLHLRDPFPKIALTGEQRKELGISVYRAPTRKAPMPDFIRRKRGRNAL